MYAKSTESASIIACLQHLWPDFELTKNHQQNPTSEIAIKFYERFICGQLQIEIDNLQRTLIENASYPDAYNDLLNVCTLYICTETVLKQLGLTELIQSFGLNDLLKPMQKKFKMSLILLSNCAIYVTGLQELMEEIKGNVLQALQNTKNIHEQIESIKEILNKDILAHIKNKQKIAESRKRNISISMEMQAPQEVHDTIKEEGKQKKTDLNKVQDEYAVLEAKVNDLLVYEDKIKTQIIDDIPSIAREKEQLLKEKNELFAESADYEYTMKEKMQTVQCSQENLVYMNKFLETTPLNKLLDNYEILNKCKSEIECHQKEIHSLDESENIDLNILKQIQDMNKCVEQEIEEDTTKHEYEMKNFEHELKAIQEEIEQEHIKIYKLKELSKELDIKIQEMKDISQQHKININKQNTYFNQKYKMILELKGRLDNKVISIIQMIKSEVGSKKK